MRPLAVLAVLATIPACGDAGGGTATASGTTTTPVTTAETTHTPTTSAGTTTGSASDALTASTGTSSSSDGGTTLLLDIGADATTDGCQPGGDATLTGTVTAPNGALPISGALVYLTHDQPTIPQTVYCSECVDLACGTPYTF